MAGWRVAASSMSAKCPLTCGRMASRSKLPTSANTSAFSADTVKWFDQNQTRRSRKGAGVEAAAASRAATSCCMIGPSCSRNVPSTVALCAAAHGVACLAEARDPAWIGLQGLTRAGERAELRDGRHSPVDLLGEPAPRVGGSGGEFAWRGAQAEAIDRDDGFDAHEPFNGPEWKFLLRDRQKMQPKEIGGSPV